jgi:choline-sulfatase
MIRQGEWKLNYYHGQPVQLFNLAEDPDELNDLAGHPDYTGVQQELIDRVLDGWDPDRIAETIRRKRADYDIIADWARNTKPVDQYRWQLLPEMDYLNK